ncbi:MAG TPA: hypothetical protein EYH07_10085, partial [Kiloniellaceae bacterium]|nr:hypothetical protein [Kiloniellaceae bacterium]
MVARDDTTAKRKPPVTGLKSGKGKENKPEDACRPDPDLTFGHGKPGAEPDLKTGVGAGEGGDTASEPDLKLPPARLDDEPGPPAQSTEAAALSEDDGKSSDKGVRSDDGSAKSKDTADVSEAFDTERKVPEGESLAESEAA